MLPPATVVGHARAETNQGNSAQEYRSETEAGKSRSRRNSVRHGLATETGFVALEDVEDYPGSKAAIVTDYDARTAVERELVLRLASLVWPMRRASAIETDLFSDPGRDPERPPV